MNEAHESATLGRHRRVSIARAASSLAAANAVALICGLVAAPIIARGLGPEGRGLLAAILAPLGMMAFIAQLSLGEYAGQRIARGARPATVFTTLVPLALGLGLLGLLVIIVLRHSLGGSQPVVERYLLIGALLLPIAMTGGLIAGIATGCERWGLVSLWQASGPIVYAVPLVVLAIVGSLTIDAAAIAALASSVVGLVFFVRAALRRRSGWRVDGPVAVGAISYGARALPGAVSVVANGRLDQILMLSLSGSRQLGLYAVAVTFAGAATSLIVSMGLAIGPSVAAGDHALIARACRLALSAALICSAGAALVTYPIFILMFGPEFEDAVGMALILLLAQIPAVGSLVIAYGLRYLGRPGLVSIADVCALVLTVPSLFLILPVLGGIGAALVSLAAYSLTFVVLLRCVARETSVPASGFVLIRPDDLRDAARRISTRLGRLRRRARD